MPKLKINTIRGIPATSAVWLEGGRKLSAGDTADVEDVAPYQRLLDDGTLVTVAGRPKKVTADGADQDPG